MYLIALYFNNGQCCDKFRKFKQKNTNFALTFYMTARNLYKQFKSTLKFQILWQSSLQRIKIKCKNKEKKLISA